MSQENIDAFLRGTDAINRGEVDIPQFVHPEVVFEPLRSATEGAYVGYDGMRRFFADTEDMFEIFEPAYPEVRDLGNCMVAIGSIRIRARGSGVEVDVPSAAVVQYRDGLLWRYKDYGDARAALSAAGDG
jgi:ketosteroid isomerase-like protein